MIQTINPPNPAMGRAIIGRYYRDSTPGHIFERLSSEAIKEHVLKNGKISYNALGSTLDSHYGTDLIYADKRHDDGRLTAWIANDPIRIDFTLDFDEKDCMPLLWAETEKDIPPLFDRRLKFGIRLGNETAGFAEPVFMIGLDMGQGKRMPTNAVSQMKIYDYMRDNADLLIREAKTAIFTCKYMMSPEFKAATDERDIRAFGERGARIKYVRPSQLSPNTKAAERPVRKDKPDKLYTNNKSGLYVAGMLLAYGLARKQIRILDLRDEETVDSIKERAFLKNLEKCIESKCPGEDFENYKLAKRPTKDELQKKLSEMAEEIESGPDDPDNGQEQESRRPGSPADNN